MSVRRGPTEQDRSEGIPTKEEPNQEQAPLVTWGAFPSNSPKAKQSAPRQTLLILRILILILILILIRKTYRIPNRLASRLKFARSTFSSRATSAHLP